MSSAWTNMFPPKPTWSVDEIPDLTGKVMLVTGGNAGIGKETVKALLNHNAKVWIAGRNPKRVAEAVEDLRKETGKVALVLHMDLADLQSIKRAVAEFLSKETRLDVLFNSGGVMTPPIEQTTKDGFDLQFGTNVIGHFYLTKLLLPLLIESAKTAPDGKVRVVNTSSGAHNMASGLDFDLYRDSPKRLKAGSMKLYAQSKFATVVFSNELHRRYGNQGIVSTSLNPGNLKTELQRNGSKITTLLSKPLLFPAPMGALTQLYAGTMPQAARLGGQYLIPWAREGLAKKETDNVELGRTLWIWLEDAVKDV
ncbi:NAD-P-binding protein [Trametes versicolor FP-101664 SS1]|uniref:NAD-P-binding protein n=1 Tax=Trametes versicolor (strain FP-101664) TaxID=717944 RepID=UPI0004623385|nr:NAD-P-binding protein [Trametes versicolor FP-101664 SS1]EIW52752.1 NAD-P-binding protein [Trametes versicolor FP-101664 SS1]